MSGQAKAPEGLPTEPADIPGLGAVTVRGATLSELLADELSFRAATDAAARTRAAAQRTVAVLARQVLDGEGRPVKTEAEWEIYGGRQMDVSLALFAKAERLSSPPPEVTEKN